MLSTPQDATAPPATTDWTLRGNGARVMVGRVRRGFAVHLIAGGLLAALMLPGVAGAKLIGPKDLSTFDGSYACFGNPSCTEVNLAVPTGTARSPVSGTIVRWHVNVADVGNPAGPLQLQVLRRTVNEPGVAGDKFKAVRESAEMVSFAGINTFQASLRIKKGDFIGLAILSDQTSIADVEKDTFGMTNFGVFNAPLVPGDPAVAPDQFPSAPAALLYNAKVRG